MNFETVAFGHTEYDQYTECLKINLKRVYFLDLKISSIQNRAKDSKEFVCFSIITQNIAM